MSELSQKKILIVDDEELLREVLGDVFRFEDADVSEAENGTMAFEMVKAGKFDAVISDIRMPGGDGIQLARNISELTENRPLVFVCSGFSDLKPDQVVEYKIAKVFDKPFNPKELVDEVSRRLKGV